MNDKAEIMNRFTTEDTESTEFLQLELLYLNSSVLSVFSVVNRFKIYMNQKLVLLIDSNIGLLKNGIKRISI